MDLDNAAREVYSRQIIINEIGEAGQRKLRDASVLVIGCGGLGSAALLYLAAMGIGCLGLCDGDVVSPSNLNRQVLYTMDDIGKPKVSVARDRLSAINPKLKITIYNHYLDERVAGEIIPHYDIVVDCLDSFDARFILNDACVAAKKPFIHAGVGEFGGQLMTVTPGTGPCLRCLFPNEKQSKRSNEVSGVVGAVPGILGTMQALEVVKYLLGLPVSNDGLVIYDSLRMNLEKIHFEASPGCVCGK
ncbi:MAG: HesA/MoeB/ThiF family protein [Oscillospiraceae bacterium]|nr:HesA/MoeB/ThiF family protein [Oscillospiraceae bacterium]